MGKSRLVLLVSLALLAVSVTGCANKWKTSGKIAMGSKNWDKALEDFGNALEQTPNDGEIHFLMAQIYNEKGEYDKMISHLQAADTLYDKGKDKIKDLRDSSWKTLFDSGNSNTKSENYEAALNDFKYATEIMPENYAAYVNAGYVSQKLKQDDNAYNYFKDAYRLEPDKINVIENLASICFNMGKYPEADSLYSKILEKDPKHVEAMTRKGMIADINGDYETAATFYNSALELEQDNCDLWFNLGVLYFQRIKDSDQALNAFSRAVELCPDDVNANINRVVVLMTLKKYDEALVNLETFTRDFPDECVGWDLYSQALLQKGMRSQALEAANKYKECQGEGK